MRDLLRVYGGRGGLFWDLAGCCAVKLGGEILGELRDRVLVLIGMFGLGVCVDFCTKVRFWVACFSEVPA